MSKKKEETTIEEQQVTTQQKTGTFILEAPTREALQEQFEALSLTTAPLFYKYQSTLNITQL